MDAQPNEFSRPISVSVLPNDGRTFEIEANAVEREALARRFGIAAVGRLAASGTLSPLAGGLRVRLVGDLDAEVVQNCVVTLQPVTSHIQARFVRLFDASVTSEWAEYEDDGGEIVISGDSDEEAFAEPFTGEMIDVGEVTAEQLSLELDPYPRAPGVAFESPAETVPTEPAPAGASPFAALAAWRKGTP